MAQRHHCWFRAPARCRPEAGVPSRPRAFSPSAMCGPRSWTRLSRTVSSIKRPSVRLCPPWEWPPPRTVTGTWSLAARRTRIDTSSTLRGIATAWGVLRTIPPKSNDRASGSSGSVLTPGNRPGPIIPVPSSGPHLPGGGAALEPTIHRRRGAPRWLRGPRRCRRRSDSGPPLRLPRSRGWLRYLRADSTPGGPGPPGFRAR